MGVSAPVVSAVHARRRFGAGGVAEVSSQCNRQYQHVLSPPLSLAAPADRRLTPSVLPWRSAPPPWRAVHHRRFFIACSPRRGGTAIATPAVAADAPAAARARPRGAPRRGLGAPPRGAAARRLRPRPAAAAAAVDGGGDGRRRPPAAPRRAAPAVAPPVSRRPRPRTGTAAARGGGGGAPAARRSAAGVCGGRPAAGVGGPGDTRGARARWGVRVGRRGRRGRRRRARGRRSPTVCQIKKNVGGEVGFSNGRCDPRGGHSTVIQNHHCK